MSKVSNAPTGIITYYQDIILCIKRGQNSVGSFTIEGHDSDYSFTIKRRGLDRLLSRSPPIEHVVEMADTTTEYTQFYRERLYLRLKMMKS